MNIGAAIGIPVVGGYVIGVQNKSAIKTWYRELKKPRIIPPDIAFPIVWTSLYTTMGYASFRVYQALSSAHALKVAATLTDIVMARPPAALPWYVLQLAINFAWCPLFFWNRKFGWALVNSSALLLALIPTTVSFWRVDKLAGKLLVPYIAWTVLATFINWRIWCDNRNVEFQLGKDGYHVKPSK